MKQKSTPLYEDPRVEALTQDPAWVANTGSGPKDQYRISLLQRLTAKEVCGFVMFAQQAPFLVFDYGWQLVQIANHQQLYPAKRPWTIPVAAQHLIDAIASKVFNYEFLLYLTNFY